MILSPTSPFFPPEINDGDHHQWKEDEEVGVIEVVVIEHLMAVVVVGEFVSNLFV